MNNVNNSKGEPLLPYEWPGSYFIDDQEIEAVTKVLKSRSLFRFYGHDLQHFADRIEAAYCERLGRKYALGTNSGTAALSLCMSALGIGPGDEVLLPGYFWVSCVSAVVRAGAIPKLVDINDTFVMDPMDLERKIGPRTKAVLLVHMSGATGELDRLVQVANAHKVPIIEDVAQANGASFNGLPLGSFGDLAIFSFQFNKGITAGEGGLVVTDNKRYYDSLVAAHDLGYPRNERGRLVTDDPELQMWGQGSRLSELAAAVLTVQERKLDTIVSTMRALNHKLYQGLDGVAGLQPRRVTDPQGDNGSFVILIWPDEETCQRMTMATREAGVRTGPEGVNNVTMEDWGLHLYYHNASLVNRRGVNAAGYPWTDPHNDFAADYRYHKGVLPVCDDLFARSSILAVPPNMTGEIVDKVITVFQECAAELSVPVPSH